MRSHRFLPFLLTPFLTPAVPLTQIDNFAQVFQIVKDLYVDPIDEELLMSYAIEGMISHLDPHSDYMDKLALSSMQESTDGQFTGIGLELSVRNNMVEIMSVINHSPASECDLHSHDIIVAIDGTMTQHMSLREASSLIRGPAGSTVILTVITPGNSTPRDVVVERRPIKNPSVQSQMIDEKWAYLQISVFGKETSADFKAQLQSLLENNPQGLVLDLRNNPGGLLHGAAQIANLFLDADKLSNKTIVFSRGQNQELSVNEQASGADITAGLPMVVLINAGSASASEILAGALQDHQRAVILGERSFGKGSVQIVLPVADSALKITCSRYFTPNDRSIQAQGIEPDITVMSHWVKEQPSAPSKIQVKEANLSRHLNVPSQTSNVTKEAANTKMSSDFQLHEAVTILTAMHLQRASEDRAYH